MFEIGLIICIKWIWHWITYKGWYAIKPKQPTNQSCIYLIYMYKEDLALNNLQWLICHKTEPNYTIVKFWLCDRVRFHGGLSLEKGLLICLLVDSKNRMILEVWIGDWCGWVVVNESLLIMPGICDCLWHGGMLTSTIHRELWHARQFGWGQRCVDGVLREEFKKITRLTQRAFAEGTA